MDIHELAERFALVREMLEAPALIADFRSCEDSSIIDSIRSKKKLLLTGEGSSRIFPAKNVRRWALSEGLDVTPVTEGSRQAAEYSLDRYVVFGASNSGKTRELIELFTDLNRENHSAFYGLTAYPFTPLEELSNRTFVLKCGAEEAVAATKSVFEQALFYRHLVSTAAGLPFDTENLAEAVGSALAADIPAGVVDAVARAETVYFAGRNDGVAEELTLKTNEITHKKSCFLEGTYLLHGIEEILTEKDAVILIDPFEEETETIRATIENEVGCAVCAVSSKSTPFPTLVIEECESLSGFVSLAMGWNLLVSVGASLGVDMDTPRRARKVGNEYRSESDR
ncbi:MAG: SIS domain-containing protein [Spirochaetia bacterium]